MRIKIVLRCQEAQEESMSISRPTVIMLNGRRDIAGTLQVTSWREVDVVDRSNRIMLMLHSFIDSHHYLIHSRVVAGGSWSTPDISIHYFLLTRGRTSTYQSELCETSPQDRWLYLAYVSFSLQHYQTTTKTRVGVWWIITTTPAAHHLWSSNCETAN